MLAKRYRLHHSVDVQRVRREGRRWRHPLAILFALPAERNMIRRDEGRAYDPVPDSRFAFAASRRVGTAVARNRAKRLLREAVHAHIEEVEPGWDCLFLARDETAYASYREVEDAVSRLLTRAHIISPPSLADRPA
jgi:ribonuclease P protein component